MTLNRALEGQVRTDLLSLILSVILTVTAVALLAWTLVSLVVELT